MKRFLGITLVLLLALVGGKAYFASPAEYANTVNTAAESKITWTHFNDAMEISKKKNKPVFIDFYTDWCGPCKKMSATTFVDAKVVEYVNENYIAVKINADKDSGFSYKGKTMTARELMKEFQVTAYPTIVMVAPNKAFAKSVGLVGPSDFIKTLTAYNASK